MKLIIENARCFAGRHTIPIKPLTVLTGENSSGKTTLLAALAAVSDYGDFPLQSNFNKPPYNWGAFGNIATDKSKSNGTSSFSLGYTDEKEEVTSFATYRSYRGEPELSYYLYSSPFNKVEWTTHSNTTADCKVSINWTHAGKSYPQDHSFNRTSMDGSHLFGDILLQHIMTAARQSFQDRLEGTSEIDFDPFEQWQEINLHRSLSLSKSVPPIRAKPERTYNSVRNVEDNTLFRLAEILGGNSANRQRTVVDALNRFGKDSGLFKNVSLEQLNNSQKLGATSGTSFQVLVEHGNRTDNLVDVGYGVSQSLPVIVESILDTERQLLLLQQPEVHLHPKAQAALGSFFANLIAESNKYFIIETHSDYLVDRVRQEVAKRKKLAADVAILFFEKRNDGTHVHQLSLDASGNILNAPPSYRAFFLKEELNLLTRAKG